MIVDGEHVHPATLRLAVAIKPRGKMMLVSDAMPPVGGKSTSFQLGGDRIECKSGICRTPGGVLAGSALDMASAVRNSVAMLGVSAEEALRMASSYPAAFLKLDRSAGSIASGKRADLAELNEDFSARSVWIGGKRV
jgi:N-acetylglucosamine-6-phosphate deacetylase